MRSIAEFGDTKLIFSDSEILEGQPMARTARVVAPGYPHHITQRGNRRQQTFFSDEDYAAYLDLMSECTGSIGLIFGLSA